MNEQKVAPLTKLIVAIFFVAFAGVFTFAFASKAGSEAGGEHAGGFRHVSLNQAMDAARTEGKLVFADFYADWCPPCKMMANSTFKDSQVIDWLDANTVAIKVNVDHERELAQRHGIRSIPTMIFFDGEGNEVARWVGGMNAKQFLREASEL